MEGVLELEKSLFCSHHANTGSCKNQWMLNLRGNFVEEQDIFMILKVLEERKEEGGERGMETWREGGR